MCISSLLAVWSCCLADFWLWGYLLHEKTCIETVRHASNAQIMAYVSSSFCVSGVRWVLNEYVRRAVLDPLRNSRVIWSSLMSGAFPCLINLTCLFRCFWWDMVDAGNLGPCRPFLRNITWDACHALSQRRIDAHERFICIDVRTTDIFFTLSIIAWAMHWALHTVL